MLRLFYFLLLMPGFSIMMMPPAHAQLRLNGAWVRIPHDPSSIKCLTLFGDRVFMQTQVDTITHHIVFAGGGPIRFTVIRWMARFCIKWAIKLSSHRIFSWC